MTTNPNGNGQNLNCEYVHLKPLSDNRNSKIDFQLIDARSLFLNEEAKKTKLTLEELKE
jgi:hypothetical protein